MPVVRSQPIEVGKFLRAEGYRVGNHMGEALNHLTGDKKCLAILGTRPDNLLGWLHLKKAVWYGTLDLFKWELEVYGEESIAPMEVLAERLENKFSQTIKILLEDEAKKTEVFPQMP